MNLTRTLTAAAAATVGLALTTTLTTLSPAQAAPTPGDATAERAAAKPFRVAAKVNRAEVRQGGRVVVTGTVKPARRGERVRLQVRYPGKAWKRTALTARLNAKGRFRIADRISSTASRSYRVAMPAAGGRKAGRSGALPVVVYSWRNLNSLTPVRWEQVSNVRELRMNGVSYLESLVSREGAEGGVDYNLTRRCRQLQTRVGLADRSETGATGTAFLTADGVQRYTKSFALTQSEAVTLPLTNVFRLSFDWTSAKTPEDPTGAYVALGNPRILCRD